MHERAGSRVISISFCRLVRIEIDLERGIVGPQCFVPGFVRNSSFCCMRRRISVSSRSSPSLSASRLIDFLLHVGVDEPAQLFRRRRALPRPGEDLRQLLHPAFGDDDPVAYPQQAFWLGAG
jgi:hypothetical protein